MMLGLGAADQQPTSFPIHVTSSYQRREWQAYDFRFRRALSKRSGAEGFEASVVGGTDGIARGGGACDALLDHGR